MEHIDKYNTGWVHKDDVRFFSTRKCTQAEWNEQYGRLRPEKQGISISRMRTLLLESPEFYLDDAELSKKLDRLRNGEYTPKTGCRQSIPLARRRNCN